MVAVEDLGTLAFDEHDIHRYEKEDREDLIKTMYDRDCIQGSIW